MSNKLDFSKIIGKNNEINNVNWNNAEDIKMLLYSLLTIDKWGEKIPDNPDLIIESLTGIKNYYQIRLISYIYSEFISSGRFLKTVWPILNKYPNLFRNISIREKNNPNFIIEALINVNDENATSFNKFVVNNIPLQVLCEIEKFWKKLIDTCKEKGVENYIEKINNLFEVVSKKPKNSKIKNRLEEINRVLGEMQEKEFVSIDQERGVDSIEALLHRREEGKKAYENYLDIIKKEIIKISEGIKLYYSEYIVPSYEDLGKVSERELIQKLKDARTKEEEVKEKIKKEISILENKNVLIQYAMDILRKSKARGMKDE